MSGSPGSGACRWISRSARTRRQGGSNTVLLRRPSGQPPHESQKYTKSWTTSSPVWIQPKTSGRELSPTFSVVHSLGCGGARADARAATGHPVGGHFGPDGVPITEHVSNPELHVTPSPMTLLSGGVPLSLLLDLVLGPNSEDLLLHEHGSEVRETYE